MKKKNLYTGLLTIIMAMSLLPAFAAWIDYQPQTITQPDGTQIECFATGDEFYNWLHDENGFTIIQNHNDGYYYYAVLEDGVLLPSDIPAGSVDPALAGLSPWTNISGEQMTAIRAEFLATQMPKKIQMEGYVSPESITNEGTLNNLVVYIRFSDQPEFTADTSFYYDMFNNDEPGYNSMLNYFESVSYENISIPSWFYPKSNTTTVVSYQDIYDRSYFMPYDPVTNPDGYMSSERGPREHELLKRACEFVEGEIPETLDIDKDSDNYVDNMVFIVKGNTTAWSTLLWPHRWVLYNEYVYIHGKRVYDYNLQIELHLNGSANGVLCHEMFHSLGAPDLYHYNSAPYTSVGPWDLMDNNANPPQSMGAYMKFRYGHWIESIPEIDECGVYTLNPISSDENNCYKIASPNSSSQFFVLEYRLKEGVFEGGLPGSGLLVYRIDGNYDGEGNAQGPPDEVYIYRPDGSLYNTGNLNQANFAADYNRTEINDNTNPDPFLQNGSEGGLNIGNIGFVGETISFEVFLEKEPVSEFTASETVITPGCEVDFYDESVCDIESWEWTFEGGTPSSSSEQHPQGITWDVPGIYSITLSTTNAWGTNTITKTGLIEVSEEALPETEFFAMDSVVCTGQVFEINDFTKVCPNAWQWEITPSTFEFTNGTGENSQHISVSLLEPGYYSVSLTAFNDNGEFTLLKEDYLHAGGNDLPFTEDFETGWPEERGWEIENPDDDITWEIFSTGGNGGEKAAGINLYNYFSIFKRDRLISPPINLTDISTAYLSFDHAYAQQMNTQYTDSLIVKISTDCGGSWTRILELGEDGTYNFATHEPYGYNFVPQTADDWCGGTLNPVCNTVDISEWAGQPDTRIMFESVRLTGNNLYVDNVVVSISTSDDEQPTGLQEDVRMYPNPTTGMVTLHLNAEHGFTTVSVFNSMGQKVREKILNQDQRSLLIDMAGEPGGIYFVSLEGQGGRLVSKLLVE